MIFPTNGFLYLFQSQRMHFCSQPSVTFSHLLDEVVMLLAVAICRSFQNCFHLLTYTVTNNAQLGVQVTLDIHKDSKKLSLLTLHFGDGSFSLFKADTELLLFIFSCRYEYRLVCPIRYHNLCLLQFLYSFGLNFCSQLFHFYR